MGEFTFVNIFTTKGVEYLWIVAYLMLLAALLPVLHRLGTSSTDTSDSEPTGKEGGEG